jgi:hypothetical protein
MRVHGIHRPVVHRVVAWRFAEEDIQLSNLRHVKAPRKKSIQKLNMACPLYSGGHAIGKACESVLP